MGRGINTRDEVVEDAIRVLIALRGKLYIRMERWTIKRRLRKKRSYEKRLYQGKRTFQGLMLWIIFIG